MYWVASALCVEISAVTTVAFPTVLAVVVTWNPDLVAFRCAVATYREQCRVLIVDNGSEPQIAAALREMVAQFSTCEFVGLPRNYGIASALNKAMSTDRSTETKYFLLLDQDSALEKDTLAKLVSASADLMGAGIERPVVGPLPVSRLTGQPIGMYRNLGPSASNPTYLKVDSLYTSGMLVPKQLALEAKQSNHLFVDYVDTEWCYRVTNCHNGSVYLVPNARIRHEVGEAVLNLRGLRSHPLLVHRPVRQYFQMRNALWLLRLKYIPLTHRIRIVARCTLRVGVLALCVRPRGERIRNFAKGWVHGLLGHPHKTNND